MKLEDLTPNASVSGILPDELVSVVSVQWYGTDAVDLVYRNSAGRLFSQLLSRSDEPNLSLARTGRLWKSGASGLLRTLRSQIHAEIHLPNPIHHHRFRRLSDAFMGR